MEDIAIGDGVIRTIRHQGRAVYGLAESQDQTKKLHAAPPVHIIFVTDPSQTLAESKGCG
jgi:hypothetical protein